MTFSSLVLFDIDGTLVRRAGAHHREALVDAVRRITGIETTTEGIPVQGMLDPDILTRMMEDAGASRAADQDTTYQRLSDARKASMCAAAPICKGKPVPASAVCSIRSTAAGFRWAWSPETSRALAGRRWSGRNCGTISASAFSPKWPLTASSLARMAIQHARRRDWIDGHAHISLIGDAPSDIIAARANGARAIAVHTGISTREELAALEPDILLEDLRGLKVEMLL